MIKCICINDKNRPESIPETHWPKFGEEYQIDMIYAQVQANAVMGVILNEIDLNEIESPYECFQIGRFGFIKEDLPRLARLIEDCKGLQHFDPGDLIQKEVLIGDSLEDFEGYLEDEGEDDPLDEL